MKITVHTTRSFLFDLGLAAFLTLFLFLAVLRVYGAGGADGDAYTGPTALLSLPDGQHLMDTLEKTAAQLTAIQLTEQDLERRHREIQEQQNQAVRQACAAVHIPAEAVQAGQCAVNTQITDPSGKQVGQVVWNKPAAPAAMPAAAPADHKLAAPAAPATSK